MLAKGVISSIDFSSNTCKVRIPQFETVNSDPIILDATISITPGIYNGYKENDVVWVAFENNMLEHPVVIGKLFLGTAKENEDPRGTINCLISTTAQKANIPQDTVLTNEVNQDTPNTQVPYTNINEIANKLNDVDVNLEYSVKDIDNRIKMKVNAVDGNKDKGWGWELSPSGWKITSGKDEVFAINEDGMTVKNRGHIGQFIIGEEHECTAVLDELKQPTVQSGIYTDGYYKSFEEYGKNNYNYYLASSQYQPKYHIIVRQENFNDQTKFNTNNILEKYFLKNISGGVTEQIVTELSIDNESIVSTDISPTETKYISSQSDVGVVLEHHDFDNDLICFGNKIVNSETNETIFTYVDNLYYIRDIGDSSWLVDTNSSSYKFEVTGGDLPTSGFNTSALYLQCVPNVDIEQCIKKDGDSYYYNYKDIENTGSSADIYISCKQFSNDDASNFKSHMEEIYTEATSVTATLLDYLDSSETKPTYKCILKLNVVFADSTEIVAYFIKLTINNDFLIYLTTNTKNYQYTRSEKPKTGVYLGTDGIRIGDFSVSAKGHATLGSITLNDLQATSLAKNNLQDGNKNAIDCNIADFKINPGDYAFKMRLEDLRKLTKNPDENPSIVSQLKNKLNLICGDTFKINSSNADRYMQRGEYSLYCEEYAYSDLDKYVSPFYLGLKPIGSLLKPETTYTASIKISKVDSNVSDVDKVFMAYYDSQYNKIIIGSSYASFLKANESSYLFFTFETPDQISTNARIFIIGFTEVSTSRWFWDFTTTTNLLISRIKVEQGETPSTFSYSMNDTLIGTLGISVTINYTDTESELDQKFAVGNTGTIQDQTSASKLQEGDTFIISAVSSDTNSKYTVFCVCLEADLLTGNISYRVANVQKIGANKIAQNLYYKTDDATFAGRTPLETSVSPSNCSETMLLADSSGHFVYAATATKLDAATSSWAWTEYSKWVVVNTSDSILSILADEDVKLIYKDLDTNNYYLSVDKIKASELTVNKVLVKDGNKTLLDAGVSSANSVLIGGLTVGEKSLSNANYKIDENGLNFYSGKILLNNNVEIGTGSTYDYIYSNGNKPFKIYNNAGAGIEFSVDTATTYTAKVKTTAAVYTEDWDGGASWAASRGSNSDNPWMRKITMKLFCSLEDTNGNRVAWNGTVPITYNISYDYYPAGTNPDIKDLTFLSPDTLDAARTSEMAAYKQSKALGNQTVSVQLTNGYGETTIVVSEVQEFYNYSRGSFKGSCIYIANYHWIIKNTVSFGWHTEPEYTFSVGGGNILYSIGSINPSTDSTNMLGSSTNRWNSVYASQGVITSSDERLKKDIEAINQDNRFDILFDKLRPVSYALIDGDTGRRHSGFVAQEVEKALKESSIDTHDFAGLIIDNKNDRYGLRYSEFISLNTSQIQKLKKRVSELEEKLNKLEKGE